MTGTRIIKNLKILSDEYDLKKKSQRGISIMVKNKEFIVGGAENTCIFKRLNVKIL